jgi:hypothetical protein
VLRGFKVLRKITLDHFDNGGTRLAVRCTANGDPRLSIELLGAGSTPHYRATIDPSETPAGQVARWETPSDLKPLQRSEIYDGHVLFHGPRFQAIRSLQGVSHAGAAGTVVGTRELGWADAAQRTDPAATDAALQLALLWGEQVLGGATLPMSVGEYRVHRAGPADGQMRCVVRAKHVQSPRAECDIVLLDPDGSPRAELLAVDLVLRPE